MTKSMNELIAERAYYYFLKRGGVHGYHHQDWSRAEAEIKAELEKSSISQVAAKQEAEVEKKVEQEKPVQKSTVKTEKKSAEKSEADKKKTAVIKKSAEKKASLKPISNLKIAKKSTKKISKLF